MSNTCEIIPTVKNKDGKVVESKLYSELLKATGNNRELATTIYLATKNKEYMDSRAKGISLDTNNEPFFFSLYKKLGLHKVISDEQMEDYLNKQMGNTSSEVITFESKTPESVDKTAKKATDFNKMSPFKDKFIAEVVIENDSVGLKISKRTPQKTKVAKKVAYNSALRTHIVSALNSIGIGISDLTEAERRAGINGVTDFDMSDHIVDGLMQMIRISNDEAGDIVLSEEFAHLALKGLKGTPIVDRLLNLIENRELYKDILGDEYEKYYREYKGDSKRLAEEAAGKLVSSHMLENKPIENNKPYRNLLQRLIDSIKNLFRRLKRADLADARRSADQISKDIAQGLLNGNLITKVDIEQLKQATGKLYNLQNRAEKGRKLVKNLLENETRRKDVYLAKHKGEKYEESRGEVLNALNSALVTGNTVLGVRTFIADACKVLPQVKDRLLAIPEFDYRDEESLIAPSITLRNSRDFIKGFASAAKLLRDAITEEEEYSDPIYGEDIRAQLKELTDIIETLESIYERINERMFLNVMKLAVGEGIELEDGRKITAETLIRTLKGEAAAFDITLKDRWLDAMADSKSDINKIFADIRERLFQRIRLEVLESKKKILAEGAILERAGVKDFKWMFESDKRNYISAIDFAKYRKAKAEMYARLEEKYGKNPKGANLTKFIEERNAWYRANLEPDTNKPKLSIYKNEEFEKIMSARTPEYAAKKRFYEFFMNHKKRLDAYLPMGDAGYLSTIKILKDNMERLKSGDILMTIKQAVKDGWVKRSDDTDFGEISVYRDFEDRKINTIPVYYTSLRRGEKLEDISEDCISTLIAYTDMAINYKHMNKAVQYMETARDHLQDHLVLKEGLEGRVLRAASNALTGVTTEKGKILEKSGRGSNTEARLNDFFEMQIYGHYIKDEGDIKIGKKRISKSKIWDNINKGTALTSLAFNVLAGISNVMTGNTMMEIEAITGTVGQGFFSVKDTAKADAAFAANLTGATLEWGNRIKRNKLNLFMELFNTLQDYETEIKLTEWDKRTWVARGFSLNSLYAINNMGEYWMQNRTALALAFATKLKYKNPDTGKVEDIDLWNALEVVDIDPSNPRAGAKLQIKKGVTKEDGTEFSDQDISDFSRMAADLNNHMHGIYNYNDRAAAQAYGAGRALFLFRKWIIPGWNKRFRSSNYNFNLKRETEGYYISTWKFLCNLTRDLKEGQFSVMTTWRNLSQTRKDNVIRATTEALKYALVVLALNLFFSDDDDDEDKGYLEAMTEYQLRRLKSEIGMFTPASMLNIPDIKNSSMLAEGFKMLKSPMAAISFMEKTSNLLGLLNPYNYETIDPEGAVLKSGPFKGMSRAERLFFDSPLAPTVGTIYRSLTPEEQLQYFKNKQ